MYAHACPTAAITCAPAPVASPLVISDQGGRSRLLSTSILAYGAPLVDPYGYYKNPRCAASFGVPQGSHAHQGIPDALASAPAWISTLSNPQDHGDAFTYHHIVQMVRFEAMQQRHFPTVYT